MKYTIKTIRQEDTEFPNKLRQIINPPKEIYVQGNLPEEQEPIIAVIGSRQAGNSSLDYTKKIAARITSKGITVISGMAKGIDWQAHQGALEKQGRTIAVLGESLNYKKRSKKNRAMLEQILAYHGCIISEVPLNENYGPRSFNLLKRNRITTALSNAVLVIESKPKSGTNSSIKYAQEQGKRVYIPEPNPNFLNYEFLKTLAKQKGINILNKENGKKFLDQILNKNFQE